MEVLIGLVIAGLVLSLAVICVMKGKWRFAVFGLFIHPLWPIGAIRLAKPGSFWAKRWYADDKRQRAEQRFNDSKLYTEPDPPHPQDSTPWEDEENSELDKITRKALRREHRGTRA